MGDYHCVVPVDWDKLQNPVLSSWCRVLGDHNYLDEFASTFAPSMTDWYTHGLSGKKAEVTDLDEFADFLSKLESKNYLQDIGWNGSIPLAAAKLRDSQAHRELHESENDYIVYLLLQEAIYRYAASNLEGPDQPDFDPFYSIGPDRIRVLPDKFEPVKVAGAKNRYRFLEALWRFRYEPEKYHYKCVSRRTSLNVLEDLLGNLFFSRRALPGSFLFDEEESWCSSSGGMPGYLTPSEVSELSIEIHKLDDTIEAQNDLLYPLFRDRVVRSAEANLGLITILHGL